MKTCFTVYLLGDGSAFDLFELMGDAPFIILTGKGDEKIAVEAMKSGASDYLIKDPDGNYLAVIRATIEKAIQNKQIKDELANYQARLEEMVQERTAELQVSQAEWENTFNAMSDWVSLIDVETHHILRTNQAGAEMLNLPVDEKEIKLFHHPEEIGTGCSKKFDFLTLTISILNCYNGNRMN